MKPRNLLWALVLVGCSESIAGPPLMPEPPGPQMVMVEGRVGVFAEYPNGYPSEDGKKKLTKEFWGPCLAIPCQPRQAVSSVFEGLQNDLDSLRQMYPNLRCALADGDGASVACLRIPVHVEDQVVWTDDDGYFTAGPFLEGTEIRAWIDHSKLPLFQVEPGGRLNCDDRVNVGVPCRGILSLFNFQFRWEGYNRYQKGLNVDTVRVTVGETNAWERDEKRAGFREPRDTPYFIIPAENGLTNILRVPSGQPKERFRRFGQPYVEGSGTILETNWNGEIVLRGEGQGYLMGYYQMLDARGQEGCGLLIQSMEGQPTSSMDGTHYSDRLGNTIDGRFFVDCNTAPANTIIWVPPPPLYP